MAKLPKPFDARAHWIRDLLHHGKREEALAMLNAAIESGTAGAETRELAEYLRTASRGRPPFGAKYLWPDIGADNDEMRSDGMSGADRMAALKAKYKIYDESKLRTYIAKWERAMDDYRAIDEEIRRP